MENENSKNTSKNNVSDKIKDILSKYSMVFIFIILLI